MKKHDTQIIDYTESQSEELETPAFILRTVGALSAEWWLTEDGPPKSQLVLCALDQVPLRPKWAPKIPILHTKTLMVPASQLISKFISVQKDNVKI